jgi:hypothetical protein
MVDHRTEPRALAAVASPEEAAAAVAALQRFMHDSAPPSPPAGGQDLNPDPWTRTALLEGVSREPGELGFPSENT